MAQVGPAVAIKQFFEKDGGKLLSTKELMEFKKACTAEEWLEYAKEAARQTDNELV